MCDNLASFVFYVIIILRTFLKVVLRQGCLFPFIRVWILVKFLNPEYMNYSSKKVNKQSVHTTKNEKRQGPSWTRQQIDSCLQKIISLRCVYDDTHRNKNKTPKLLW